MTNDVASPDEIDTIGRVIVLLGRAVRQEVDRRMAAHGLSDAQWKPLWHLRAGRNATVGELAVEADIDMGAMTRVLDRLVAKGYVERFRGQTDRRTVWIRLTATGDRASTQIPEVLAAVNQGLLCGLSPSERRRVAAALTRLHQNVLALAGEDLGTSGGSLPAPTGP